MKILTLAARNTKEILRDPLNFAFALGFPVIILLLLSAIQKNVPVPVFELQSLAPATAVFGLSFITLSSAMLLSNDRDTAFLVRLYTTRLTAADFILGYTLPMIPLSVCQAAICYLLAVILGLEFTVNIVYAVLFIIIISLFYISCGLLCGSIMNAKQAGGICGALLTNLAAWLSGAWFEIDMLGKGVETVAKLLPFYHAVELERAVVAGRFSDITAHLLWVVGYAVVFTVLAVLLFLRQMKSDRRH